METMNNYGIIIGHISNRELYAAIMDSIDKVKEEQYQETESGK